MTLETIIVDVRTREEFYKEHIRGAVNIPFYDFGFYDDFFRGKKIKCYCNTGHRSKIAVQRLLEAGYDAVLITDYEIREKVVSEIVAAMNFVVLRSGAEKDFLEKVKMLCRSTENYPGFLGSKLLSVSGLSGVGSFLPGDFRNLKFNPRKFIIVTYWKSKEEHEKSHEIEEFKEIFERLPEYCAAVPYEEFYDIIK